MPIRLVSYEPVHEWILGKFALKMRDNIAAMNRCGEISSAPEPASVCHHISFPWPQNHFLEAANAAGFSPPPLHTCVPAIDAFVNTYRGIVRKAPAETLMITHVNSPERLSWLTPLLQVYDMGICMSQDMREFLCGMGMPAERLCYVNPAHDGVIRPRPLVLGLASRVYADGRKQERRIVEAPRSLPPQDFIVAIMGAGWDAHVAALREAGFTVRYHNAFDYDVYTRAFMPSLDYFIYFSHDEGAMAYMDALAACVKTIVTPQGYHLDIAGGIDHYIYDAEDLRNILRQINQDRQSQAGRVSAWTWPEYTWRHIIIWDFLLHRDNPDVAAEKRTFFKLLPKLAPSDWEQVVRGLSLSVPEEEVLLLAAETAGQRGLHALHSQYLRQALIFYPKNRLTRELALALYPAYAKLQANELQLA